MGAEVIKVEAPGKGDPGRGSELHTVLGQAKKSIVLDLKKPQAVEVARALAATSDILIENYATGVMDRLGLGAEALKAVNPDLIYISASGMGRTGPESQSVAYGTLLQCYAGFAGLNRHPGVAPRIGLAWLDPMCGLMLAFAAAAALWHRQHKGGVARIDFSMIEAMLWTMAEPLVATQLGTPAKPMGNESTRYAPHGVWRCAGDDDWISIVARTDPEWRALCTLVPGLSGMAALDLGRRIDARARDRCSAGRLGRLPAGLCCRRIAAEGRHSRFRPRAHRGSAEKPASCQPQILGQARCRCAAGIALARKLRPHRRPRAGTGRGFRPCARRRPWAGAGTYRRTADERSAWLVLPDRGPPRSGSDRVRSCHSCRREDAGLEARGPARVRTLRCDTPRRAALHPLPKDPARHRRACAACRRSSACVSR